MSTNGANGSGSGSGSGLSKYHYSKQAAPWGRLREWIAEKEAWESEHGDAAPLSSTELAAISQLVPLIEEPNIDDDYVSALMSECTSSLPNMTMNIPS